METRRWHSLISTLISNLSRSAGGFFSATGCARRDRPLRLALKPKVASVAVARWLGLRRLCFAHRGFLSHDAVKRSASSSKRRDTVT